MGNQIQGFFYTNHNIFDAKSAVELGLLSFLLYINGQKYKILNSKENWGKIMKNAEEKNEWGAMKTVRTLRTIRAIRSERLRE